MGMGIFCVLFLGYLGWNWFWGYTNKSLDRLFLKNSVIFRIEKGREILSDSSLKCEWKMDKNGSLLQMKMFLAVWDSTAKETEIIEIEKRKVKDKWRIVSSVPEVIVQEIEIPGPNSYWILGKQLLAVKMPWRNRERVEEIIYTPYTEGIRCSELELVGRAYLEDLIRKAFAELEKKRVFSRAFPDRLVSVSHVIPQDLVQNLILTEHFFDDLGKVYVILGANRETAFNYTESNKDALGLTQFIEPTYQSIVELYPEALLETDFQFGMRDHINAIEAMILLCDANLRLIRKRVREVELPLVSMYNGGTRKKLPRETRLYLEKYKFIRDIG